jgi:microcystin-dependent protein
VHSHVLQTSSAAATVDVPSTSATLAATKPARGSTVPLDIYATPGTTVPLAAGALATTGGGRTHENRQPYLALNYIIALIGIFPSRN